MLPGLRIVNRTVAYWHARLLGDCGTAIGIDCGYVRWTARCYNEATMRSPMVPELSTGRFVLRP